MNIATDCEKGKRLNFRVSQKDIMTN